MKRLLLLAAAMCCISLVSCDNEMDSNELSPFELEVLELDNLIASQSGFDEEALIADLCNGTMKMQRWYEYNDDNISEIRLVGGHCAGDIVIFFTEGICFDCYISDLMPDMKSYPCNAQFSWRYDPTTKSLITKQQDDNIYSEGSAKVLYYNTEDHRLIIEGDFMHLESILKLERVRISGYIDVDPAERERIIEEYCNK